MRFVSAVREYSGPIVTFFTSVAKPLKNLIIDLKPIQTGSGDPSPDNVRPISGRTGAEAYVSPTQDVADATTYPVTWQTEAGTVYGGTVDVVTGKLTVNMVYKNARDLTWNWAGGTYLYAVVTSAQISDAKRPSSNTKAANVLCSVAVKNAISNMAGQQHQPGIGISATSGNMALKLPQIESEDDWNDFIENTDVDIVYELATPIEYTLTPQEVLTLAETMNNVWSDSGDVTVRL